MTIYALLVVVVAAHARTFSYFTLITAPPGDLNPTPHPVSVLILHSREIQSAVTDCSDRAAGVEKQNN